MRVSVALCAYNGARFLGEQLQSIAAQTLLPCEVVVCDDGSTDGTLGIAEAFAASAPFPVRIFANEKNLGVVQNFGKAIGLCQGDFIALSDQDDVWRPDKLRLLTDAFAHSPNLGLIFSNAQIVREDLTPTGEMLFDWAGVSEKERAALRDGTAFEMLLARNIVTGATLIFQAKYLPLVLPMTETGYLAHDAWIALLISAVSPIALHDDPLIQYRQHEAQTQGLREHVRKSEPDRFYQTHLRQLTAVRDRLAQWSAQAETAGVTAKIQRVKRQMEHLEARISLPARRIQRCPAIARELLTGRYSRYSNGLYSAARDLIHRKQEPS